MSDKDKRLSEVENMNAQNLELEEIEHILASLPDEDLPAGFEEQVFEKLGIEHIVSSSQSDGSSDNPNDTFKKRRERLMNREANSIKKAKKIAYGFITIAAVFVIFVVGTYIFDDYGYDNSYKEAEKPRSEEPVYEEKAEDQSFDDAKKSKADFDSVDVEDADGGGSFENALSSTDEKAIKGDKDFSSSNSSKPGDLDKRKLIYRANLNVTVDSYHDSFNDIKAKIATYGGYIEENRTWVEVFFEGTKREQTVTTGYLTIRIPQEFYREFMDGFSSIGEVSNLNETVQDITANYRDIEEETLNLEAREKALRELMDKAETMEDILAVDRELNSVRGMINSYRGTLKDYDRLVDMATITVQLDEKLKDVEIEPIDDSLGTRIQNSFNKTINKMVDFGENIVVNIVGRSPFYISAIVLLLIVFLLVKLIYKAVVKRLDR